MEYRKIVSVTGMTGLYELVSSKADGGVVRSLEDKTSKFVSNRIHAFSQLEGIEIYTTDENVNLVEIFNAMKASKEKMPSGNADGKEIKAYFQKVYPSMDFERVYGSDMKKMVKWYEILTKEGIEIKLSDETDEEAVPGAEQTVTEKKTASKSVAAAPKAASPKAAPPKKITTPRKMS